MKGKTKYAVGVYCSEEDLQHPALVHVAIKSGIVKESSYRYGKLLYTREELSLILEKILGFKNGEYTEENIKKQRNRFDNNIVKNKNRYTGFERLDKDWVESGMASQEAKEIYKWGEPL